MKQIYKNKIGETKSRLFVKVNKVDKPLATDWPRKKKIQITKISSERGDISSILTELVSIVEEYYDQLYVINLEAKVKWVMNF